MSTPDLPSRRRVLRVLALAPAALAGSAGARSAPPTVWQGLALGAQARIVIEHPDPGLARALLDQCREEIRRLEDIFSLYRPMSALRVLNREGVLRAPPPELTELLSRARALWELTGGAFDVTVQPLWEALSAHYARPGTGSAPPEPEVLEAARARVGMERVEIASPRIAFTAPGTAITLNGIAQGYVTDRIAALLEAAGFRHVLLDVGELRALGRHADGRPWRVGIRTPRISLAHAVELDGGRLGALATSAGAGTPIAPDGRYHHLFDPRLGTSTHRYEAVSVLAREATLADGLSTGFAAMSEPEIRAVVGRLAGVRAWLFERGRAVQIGQGPEAAPGTRIPGGA